MIYNLQKEYLLNIPEIDSQHEKLINICNRLEDMLYGNEADILKLMQIVDEIKEYVQYHFSCEEVYMEEQGYSDIKAHIEKHEEFRKFLDKYTKEYVEKNSKQVLFELTKYVVAWILDIYFLQIKCMLTQ